MNVKGQGEVPLLDVLVDSEKVLDFLWALNDGKPPEGQITQEMVQRFMAMMGAGMLVTVDFYRQQAEELVVAEALEILGKQGG